MAAAARALGVPVISGNVSLYNETNGEAIWPTPVVGCVGCIDDAERAVPMGFPRAGLTVALLSGADAPFGAESLAGSEYLRMATGAVAGTPRIDLDAEARLQRALVALAGAGVLASAHDVAAGGLAVAVAESCIAGGVGARLSLGGGRRDARLFGEPQSVAVVATHDIAALRATCERGGVAVRELGATGGDRIELDEISVALADARDAYETGLPRALAGVDANA